MKARSFFYKTSTLIEEGILTLFNNDFTSDLMECNVSQVFNQTLRWLFYLPYPFVILANNVGCQVKLDRRLFDFLIGLDTEMSGMCLLLIDQYIKNLILILHRISCYCIWQN